jgi:hypothetical protein
MEDKTERMINDTGCNNMPGQDIRPMCEPRWSDFPLYIQSLAKEHIPSIGIVFDRRIIAYRVVIDQQPVDIDQQFRVVLALVLTDNDTRIQ